MRLKEWRESKGFSLKQMVIFMRMVEDYGYNNSSSAYQSLRHYELCAVDFPLRLIPRLIEITNGDVALDDLIEMHFADEEKPKQAAE